MLLYSREDAEKACIEAIEHARAVNNNTTDKQYKIEERHKRQNEYEHSKNRNCIRRNAGPQWQHGLCLGRYILLAARGKSHW